MTWAGCSLHTSDQSKTKARSMSFFCTLRLRTWARLDDTAPRRRRSESCPASVFLDLGKLSNGRSRRVLTRVANEVSLFWPTVGPVENVGLLWPASHLGIFHEALTEGRKRCRRINSTITRALSSVGSAGLVSLRADVGAASHCAVSMHLARRHPFVTKKVRAAKKH